FLAREHHEAGVEHQAGGTAAAAAGHVRGDHADRLPAAEAAAADALEEGYLGALRQHHRRLISAAARGAPGPLRGRVARRFEESDVAGSVRVDATLRGEVGYASAQ